MPDLVGVPDGMAENRVSPAFLVGTEHGLENTGAIVALEFP